MIHVCKGCDWTFNMNILYVYKGIIQMLGFDESLYLWCHSDITVLVPFYKLPNVFSMKDCRKEAHCSLLNLSCFWVNKLSSRQQKLPTIVIQFMFQQMENFSIFAKLLTVAAHFVWYWPFLTSLQQFSHAMLLAHLLIADEPMQSWNVRHVSSLALLVSLLSSSTVDSPPVHRFDHRNSISCTYMYICP